MIGLGIGVAWAYKKINRYIANLILSFRLRVLAEGGVFEAESCLENQLSSLQGIGLLNDASLVVTPNAYKASVLYGIVPNTALGDLDVVRATSATRVDANGLVEIPRTNLLTNSDGNLATYTTNSNVSNAIVPINGFTNSIQFGDNSVSRFAYKRTFTPTIGIQYVLSVFVQMDDDSLPIVGSTNSTGDFSLIINGNTANINVLAQRVNDTNVYRCSASFVAISTNTQFGVNKFVTQSVKGFKITGIQLETGVSATEYIPTIASIRTKFAGITQDGSSASNIPRLDYTNGSCPSILVEPQRTNLALRSEEFDNASWTKIAANVTANATTSPSGNLTAEKLIATAASSTHLIVQQPAGAVSGTTATVSVFAKASELSRIQFLNNGGGLGVADFNLSAGTATLVSGVSASIQNVSNGWYRCIMSYIPTITGNYNIQIRLADSSGNTTFLGNGTDGLFIWGAQIEAGANATSYIPTTSASVTRNLDSFSTTNLISKGLIVNDYTLFLDITNPILGSQFVLDPRDISNIRTGILRVSGTNASVTDITGGSSLSMLNALTIGRAKMCVKRTGSVISFFTNGVKFASTTTTTAGTINNLQTGVANSTNSSFINSIILFPTALTDTECINLTTL
jgi:hypothetical protein